eukprot:gene26684-biopygen66177
MGGLAAPGGTGCMGYLWETVCSVHPASSLRRTVLHKGVATRAGDEGTFPDPCPWPYMAAAPRWTLREVRRCGELALTRQTDKPMHASPHVVVGRRGGARRGRSRGAAVGPRLRTRGDGWGRCCCGYVVRAVP